MACSKDLSKCTLTGSEEMFDFYCQPCSAEKHVEAVGYCQQCCEYLCVTCSNYHGKLSATKHHKVLDKLKMPKVNTPIEVQNSDVITETCTKHHGKVLEYICQNHNQVCCSVCLTLNHSSCSDKSYIPDVSADIARSQEYKTLTGDLGMLVEQIKKRQKKIKDYSTNNDNDHIKALANIDIFRKQINDLLDNFEEDTKRKVAKLHRQNSDAVKGTSEKFDILLSEMKSLVTEMEEITKSGKNNQLFLQVKLSCQRIPEAQREIKENDKCNATRYAFYHDEKIQQIVSTLSALWSLSVRQDDTHTTARYLREVNVKSVDDTNECDINGIAVLTRDRVVLTDHINEKIKLINIELDKLSSWLSLSSYPFDIVEINQNKIAVAVSNIGKIEIVNVSDVLTRSHTIDISDAVVAGLCYDGTTFITACQSPGSIKIIDMCGRTLNTIASDNHGNQIFNKPRHISLDICKEIVYVTDKDANTVICLATDGRVISVYGHDILKYPDGVAVGKDGSVYVCIRRSDVIHQLSPTGEFKRLTLSKDNNIAKNPHAISYSEDDERLYVSSGSNRAEDKNYIRLYQLE